MHTYILCMYKKLYLVVEDNFKYEAFVQMLVLINKWNWMQQTFEWTHVKSAQTRYRLICPVLGSRQN